VEIDLIVRAKEIITLDRRRPSANALGVLHGRIVGFDEELDGVTAAHEQDFGDAVMTPGLIDAHCHTTWWGLGLGTVDLSVVRGLDQLYAALESEVQRLNDAGDSESWVQGTGFNQKHHGGQFPDIARLDEISGQRPMYLRHTSGHAAITNSATLKMIGAFETDFADPVGGKVVRDSSDAPTGLVEEAAQGLVQNLLLPYSRDAIVAALDDATKRYAAEGITSFTEAGVGGGWISHSPAEIGAYQQAADEGKLHARAQLMPTLDALTAITANSHDFCGEGEAHGVQLGIRYGFGDDTVRLGHVKVFMDGSLLGATAAVTEEFCGHGHGHGYLLDDPEQYRRRVYGAYRAGFPIALHAIGDAAIDLALELIEHCQSAYGKTAVPCRVEHFGIARSDQLEKARALGIAVTPQAGFIGPIGDQMMKMVGPQREAWLYRGRSIIDAGITLAGSSDLPVADNNIRRGMQSAVDRLTDSGQVLAEAEGITPEEALRSYTEWAAVATGQIGDKGTLSTGKFADFVVFDQSPLEISDRNDLTVIATCVGGNSTYVKS
jgi:predicted amidohydrolase YtcJ